MIISILAVLGIGSIFAALVAWRTAISNHRQAWINDLRDDLATYLKELENMHYADRSLFSAKTDDGNLEKQKEDAKLAVVFTYWRIVLRLNRTEQMHVELRQRLDDLMMVTDKVPDRDKINDTVDLARRILKREWDVTKYWPLTDVVLRFKHLADH